MKSQRPKRLLILAGIIALIAGGFWFARKGNSSGVPQAVTVSGSASFESETNVSSIEVHGASKQLKGTASVTKDGNDLSVKLIDVSVPVKSLATGMALRDEHMQSYIFKTADGKYPDMRFTSESPTECSVAAGCTIHGNLTIQDKTKPLVLAVKIKDQGAGYQVSGTGEVKLSDYGIEQPSQLGVTSKNEVQFTLQFSAKAAS